MQRLFAISVQCLKLRVHPAPGAHISADGRTFCGRVCPACARFFNELLWLYIRVVHGKTAGCTFYEPVHPGGVQNKSLISNTAVGTLFRSP